MLSFMLQKRVKKCRHFGRHFLPKNLSLRTSAHAGVAILK